MSNISERNIIDYDLSVKWVSQLHWNRSFKIGDKIAIGFSRGRDRIGEIVSITLSYPIRLVYKYGGAKYTIGPGEHVKYGYSLEHKRERYLEQKQYEQYSANERAEKLLTKSRKTVFKEKKSKQSKTPQIKGCNSSDEVRSYLSDYAYTPPPNSLRRKGDTHTHNDTEHQVTQTYTSIFGDVDDNENIAAGDLFNEIVIITDEDFEKLVKYHSDFRLLSQMKKSQLVDQEIENFIKANNINVPKKFQIDDSKIKKSYERYIRKFESVHGDSVLNSLKLNFNFNFIEYSKMKTEKPVKDIQDTFDDFKPRNDYVGSARQYNTDVHNESYADYDDYYANNGNYGYSANYELHQEDVSSVSGNSVYYETTSQLDNQDNQSYYSSVVESEPSETSSEEDEDFYSDNNSCYYSLKSYSFYDENSVDSHSVVQNKMETWQKCDDKYSHLFDSNPDFLRDYKKLDDLLNDGFILEGEYYNRKIDLIVEHFDSKTTLKSNKKEITFKELVVPTITSHF